MLDQDDEDDVGIEKHDSAMEFLQNLRFQVDDPSEHSHKGNTNKQPRKRKKTKVDGNGSDDSEEDNAEHFEDRYKEIKKYEGEKKPMKDLLPIKTKEGRLVGRTGLVEKKAKLDDEDEIEFDGDNQEEDDEEAEDSDADIVQGDFDGEINPADDLKNKKSVSTTDLLIRREQEVNKQKYRIGIICSGILEKPEDKMKNFLALFEMMDDQMVDGSVNLLTVRKIATMSVLEIFKDIVPEYRIGMVDLNSAKVKKTTLERATFENSLLTHYKKYLQKLEKISSLISKRKGDVREDVGKDSYKLGKVAVSCMCELLIAHPNFNFGQNIAQLLVFLSNNRSAEIREMVSKCFIEVFKTDKRLDLTLFIIRRLNHLIKTKTNHVYVEVLSSLTSLTIKSINLDHDKENELKQKKLEAHKQRLVNMSKRERKRRKKLTEVEKELSETKAEENKQTQQYKLTEITKMLFNIYFRILKNDPNSKLLSSALEGLAKFSHLINMDFFSDLVNTLDYLMAHSELGYKEQLHCIQTVFTILSGQGEVLNIDPIRFYTHLYKILLDVNSGKTHKDLGVVLRILEDVLVKRRKNINQQRLLAFIKRISILSLQVTHNGTLGILAIVKQVMQLTNTLDILLDTDTSVGSGKYDPALEDPEYSNANSTSLYELCALTRHYHPIVKKMANHLSAGVPIAGEGSLNPEIGKL